MVYFPFCKINLGLHVLSRQTDGYHSIETCFYGVPWTDILEIIPAKEFLFDASGVKIPGDPADNLCLKAWNLLKNDHDIPPVQLYLHKIIPPGAGLGGGSSNASFTLKALNEIFSLGLELKQLKAYAAKLGSDCSFFLESVPMMGSGRGDILTPVQVNIQGKFLALIIPDIFVSSREAYKMVVPSESRVSLAEILRKPVSQWKGLLRNDFEDSVFRLHPLIGEIKQKLYSLGASYASMSGSGSGVYGIFDAPCDLKEHFPAWPVWSAGLN